MTSAQGQDTTRKDSARYTQPSSPIQEERSVNPFRAQVISPGISARATARNTTMGV